jgi:hypothetical protein
MNQLHLGRAKHSCIISSSVSSIFIDFLPNAGPGLELRSLHVGFLVDKVTKVDFFPSASVYLLS